MLAKDLVSILSEYNSDYSRQTLLSEIDYVQKIVLGNANMVNKVIDPTTGGDPLLHIATAVTVIPDAMKISKVYSGGDEIPLSVHIYGNTIVFKPEHVGSSFYVRYFKKTPGVLLENTELLIPDDVMDMFEDAVKARLAKKEHGSGEEWLLWKKISLKQLQRRINYNYRWE